MESLAYFITIKGLCHKAFVSNLGKYAIVWIISIGNLRGKQLLVILRKLIMVRVNTETLSLQKIHAQFVYLNYIHVQIHALFLLHVFKTRTILYA